MNESEALLTSMNLYEFSQVNNEEMGVLVSKSEDPDLFDEVSEEVMRLIRISEGVRVTVEKVEKEETPAKAKGKLSTRSKSATPTDGHCIRCSTSIKANPLRPYCRSCYEIWNRHSDPDHEDSICHLCGKENPSTLNKPTCYSCYRKHSNDFEFATGSARS